MHFCERHRGHVIWLRVRWSDWAAGGHVIWLRVRWSDWAAGGHVIWLRVRWSDWAAGGHVIWLRVRWSDWAEGGHVIWLTVRWSDWAAGGHVIWLRVRCGFTADCWQTCGSLSGAESRKQQQMPPGRRDYANRACVFLSNTSESERALTLCYNKQTKRQCIRSNGWSVWEACLFTLACLIDGWRGDECWRVWLRFQCYVYSLLFCLLTPANANKT